MTEYRHCASVASVIARHRHCESAHKNSQLTTKFLADEAIPTSILGTKLNQHPLYSLQMILEQIATPKTSEQVPKFWVRNDERASLRVRQQKIATNDKLSGG